MGVSAGGVVGGVSHVGYFNNRDSDGLTTSFRIGAKGYSNTIMDPFLRSTYVPAAASSNNDENPTTVDTASSALSSQDLVVIVGAVGKKRI